jgi:hypothetical protein
MKVPGAQGDYLVQLVQFSYDDRISPKPPLGLEKSLEDL